jgi:hypothetical protein
MAGDWIKMRVDLRDDPAVFRMAELLSIDELHVIGCLFCFWAWADKHAVDGRVDGATTRLVDKVSMRPGIADALVAVGWLSFDDSGLQIPNFERHNGESAKERGLKNARQARWRAGKGANVDASASTQTSTQASTEPSTREEKRREEKNTSSLRSEVEPRKRAPQVARPDDVDEQTWADWLALRKAKKAPVTETVIDQARREASKAVMPLADFLRIWCARGSQGLQADWIKPGERQASTPMSFAKQDELAKRRRWEEMTGRKWPEAGVVDMDAAPAAAMELLQ